MGLLEFLCHSVRFSLMGKGDPLMVHEQRRDLKKGMFRAYTG
jgi:hypothetical protein